MAKVTITVRVILNPLMGNEFGLHVGFRGLGGWYEPSKDSPQPETVKKFRARKYTGPHYVSAITTGSDVEKIRAARTIVGVGRKNKTIELKPK